MNTPLRYRLLSGTALVMLVAGVGYSCKDWLNTPAQGTLDETSLQTHAGVEATLIAAYRALDCTNSTNGNWGCAASNWVWGSVAADDAYKGSNAPDQPPIFDIESYAWSTGDAESYLNVKWANVYEGVVRANATLRLLKEVQAAKPGEISAADALGIKGEAMFLRAHYHFEAWRMWGNIPYYYETDTDFRKTNQGVNAPALIAQDLDSAIAYLPATPRNGEKGRVTSWTAKAYKGRLQVYTGQFAAAVTTLTDVKNNGPYALQPDFHQVWSGFPQYADGPETILAYQASVNDGEPNGNNGNYGERLNFPYGLGFCCGFHQPSQNLVNFFQVDAAGLPLALTSATWNANSANFAANTTTPVDPRLDWTVGRDFVPYKDWGLHNPTFIRDIAYSGPYSPKKNVHEKASGAQSKVGWLPAQLNSVHIHIYRYADMLLLLAEADVETGALEAARAIVNQIRARAGAVAQGCGSGTDSLTLAKYPSCAGDSRLTVPLLAGASVDSLSEPWAFYKIGQYTTPWVNQAAARGYVQYERRLELAMEGQRFFDLRRWVSGAGYVADSAIPAYVAVEKTRRTWLAAAVWQTRHHLYPIPATQIDLSKVGGVSKLVQNPGW
jgi:starch-binding outer membrane protein, SusD/RagB family